MGIRVSNLSKKYGPQYAVNDISFEIQTGEIVGFLGPNGAGKSTTMRMLTCYVSPDTGSATVAGSDIRTEPEQVRRKIGYLPENNPLYEDMSIVAYLQLTAELQKVPKKEIRPRIREMIALCGLTREQHKNIGELSKGYRQRVGLAQALIHDPKVLILDEPTTGLDPNQIIEIRELIKKIGREKTVILSSHILKAVEMTCDRILIINRGELVADDSTENLRRRAKGADRIRLQIRTELNAQDLKALLEDLPTVAEVTPDAGLNQYILDSKPDADIRADVFHFCADKKMVLTEMTTLESSLEDIFRELTISQTES